MVRVGGAQRHSQGQRSVDSKPGKETQRWRHAVGGSERRGCEETDGAEGRRECWHAEETWDRDGRMQRCAETRGESRAKRARDPGHLPAEMRLAGGPREGQWGEILEGDQDRETQRLPETESGREGLGTRAGRRGCVGTGRVFPSNPGPSTLPPPPGAGIPASRPDPCGRVSLLLNPDPPPTACSSHPYPKPTLNSRHSREARLPFAFGPPHRQRPPAHPSPPPSSPRSGF